MFSVSNVPLGAPNNPTTSTATYRSHKTQVSTKPMAESVTNDAPLMDNNDLLSTGRVSELMSHPSPTQIASFKGTIDNGSIVP